MGQKKFWTRVGCHCELTTGLKIMQEAWKWFTGSFVPPGSALTSMAHVLELDALALTFSGGEILLLHTPNQQVEEVLPLNADKECSFIFQYF